MGLVLLERIIFPAPLIKVSKTHYLKQGGEKTGFFNNPKQIGLSEILHFSKVGFSAVGKTTAFFCCSNYGSLRLLKNTAFLGCFKLYLVSYVTYIPYSCLKLRAHSVVCSFSSWLDLYHPSIVWNYSHLKRLETTVLPLSVIWNQNLPSVGWN